MDYAFAKSVDERLDWTLGDLKTLRTILETMNVELEHLRTDLAQIGHSVAELTVIIEGIMCKLRDLETANAKDTKTRSAGTG